MSVLSGNSRVPAYMQITHFSMRQVGYLSRNSANNTKKTVQFHQTTFSQRRSAVIAQLRSSLTYSVYQHGSIKSINLNQWKNETNFPSNYNFKNHPPRYQQTSNYFGKIQLPVYLINLKIPTNKSDNTITSMNDQFLALKISANGIAKMLRISKN